MFKVELYGRVRRAVRVEGRSERAVALEFGISRETVSQRVAALRFFFVKTLKRHHMLEFLPFPRLPERLPTVLSQDE
jgi:hypothetical protein